MSKRGKLSSGKSKRMFTKHASHVHKKNMPQRTAMRGGIRL